MNRQQKLERRICNHVSKPPLAMYDLGVGPADGSKREWETLAAEYPEMRLFGCEPDPARHAALEGIFPGELLKVAIGAEPGRLSLHVDPTGRAAASFRNGRNLVDRVEVDVITLDDFDAACGRPDRILLWADIEGAELDAIRGGRELLGSGRVRWINLEIGRWPYRQADQGWPDPTAIINRLFDLGFDLVETYNQHKTHCDAIFVRE